MKLFGQELVFNTVISLSSFFLKDALSSSPFRQYLLTKTTLFLIRWTEVLPRMPQRVLYNSNIRPSTFWGCWVPPPLKLSTDIASLYMQCMMGDIPESLPLVQ